MGSLELFIFVMVLWVFSVCIHEWGHAIVAYYGGDYTVKEKGYLTLNPTLYVDPFGSILLPLIFLLMGGIGLPGGAVYIERDLLRNKWWSLGMSLAGPAMNAVLVIVLCIPFWTGMVAQDPKSQLACALAFLIMLQITAVLFNLLPVPPLDGFQAVSNWMTEQRRMELLQHSNMYLFGTFIVMSAIPVVSNIFWGRVYGIMLFLGIDPYLADYGQQSFQFWKS
jgi:Zn-dependent protease